MATKRMRTLRPFNGFPQSTDANIGYVIQLCRGCGNRICVPFNQVGREPEICESCYSGGL
ncbi:MAG: hypothetical protein ABEJ87_05265 [Candidatus Nanohalobium sp.]